MNMKEQRIFELGPYRPQHEAEIVDPSHITEMYGKPFIPVRVYGHKPNLPATELNTDKGNSVANSNQPQSITTIPINQAKI